MSTQEIFDAVLTFNMAEVKIKTQAELDAGTEISAILNEGLISPMDVVGERFSTGELFVPEMLMAAKVMKAGLEILKPYLSADRAKNKGTVVIGTVKGDMHDIGKNIVAMMMEGSGYDVVDVGVDVANENFVRAAVENNARIVALSALLTTTMPAMEDAVKAIKEAGLPVKTIVGGAPVSQKYADRIGADGFAMDAPGAVRLVRQLIAGS